MLKPSRPPEAARRRRRRTAALRLGACALAATAAAAAQAQSGAARTYYVQPSLTLTQTLTDNGRLDGGDRGTEAITKVRPSVRVSARGPRVQGTLVYAVEGTVYARESDDNDVRQSLNLSSSGGLELVEDRLFLDGGARISQQLITPFGDQPPDESRASDNLTQVASYRLSPYLVGNLGSTARYRLGLNHSATIAADESRFDGTTSSAQLDVTSGPAFGPLGWGVTAVRVVSDYDAGRRTEADSLLGTVSYVVDHDLVVRANAGMDWNDYRTVDKESYRRYGVGAEWRPTERTLLSAQVDDRFFGTGYNVVFQHRTPRTVWSFSDSRDVTDVSGRTTAAVGTAFDLFYAQFASIQPDPLLREQLVLQFLQLNGIPPDTLLLSDFLFSSGTVQRRQRLSFALLGKRSTLTVAATQSRNSRADTLTNVGDVFADTAFVRQRGLSVDVAHRLTPESSLNLLLAEQRSSGELDTQSTRRRQASLTWSVRVGWRTNFSLAARRTEFDRPTGGYEENALIASLTMRFN